MALSINPPPSEWVGDSVAPPNTITMRSKCACGGLTGQIVVKGGNNCVYCDGCGKFKYNAPKSETGQRKAQQDDAAWDGPSKLCVSHIPPFDAIETLDSNRRGWIRSECRQCGKFLGYRPEGVQ